MIYLRDRLAKKNDNQIENLVTEAMKYKPKPNGPRDNLLKLKFSELFSNIFN